MAAFAPQRKRPLPEEVPAKAPDFKPGVYAKSRAAAKATVQ